MNCFSRLILIVILPLNALATDSAMRICKTHLQELKDSMNQRIQVQVAPAVSNFLIELYENAGLTLNPTDIELKGISEHLMGVSLDFALRHESAPGVYSGNLWNAFDQSVAIREATDNAVWDSLGNLVTPATEVKCVAERSFRQDMGIFNENTGKAVGSIDVPADEVGFPSYFLIHQKFPIN